MKQPFFIVWSPQGATPPRERHDSFFKAQKEAERLAMLKPGCDFFVMQAHCRVATTSPIEIEHFDVDGVPF